VDCDEFTYIKQSKKKAKVYPPDTIKKRLKKEHYTRGLETLSLNLLESTEWR
jgi:hypothetical protein